MPSIHLGPVDWLIIVTYFAFVVGIPTMFAATGYELLSMLKDGGIGNEDWSALGIAFVASALTAFAATSRSKLGRSDNVFSANPAARFGSSRATNSVANQSSNSGCVGRPPAAPKSLGVSTSPTPKWCCQTRLTITRATKGFSGSINCKPNS